MKVKVPFVGRHVHYTAYGTPKGEFKSEKRAAVITRVHTPGDPYSDIDVCVFNPTGLFFNGPIKYGPGEPGCWENFEYVPDVDLEAPDVR